MTIRKAGCLYNFLIRLNSWWNNQILVYLSRHHKQIITYQITLHNYLATLSDDMKLQETGYFQKGILQQHSPFQIFPFAVP